MVNIIALNNIHVLFDVYYDMFLFTVSFPEWRRQNILCLRYYKIMCFENATRMNCVNRRNKCTFFWSGSNVFVNIDWRRGLTHNLGVLSPQFPVFTLMACVTYLIVLILFDFYWRTLKYIFFRLLFSFILDYFTVKLIYPCFVIKHEFINYWSITIKLF